MEIISSTEPTNRGQMEAIPEAVRDIRNSHVQLSVIEFRDLSCAAHSDSPIRAAGCGLTVLQPRFRRPFEYDVAVLIGNDRYESIKNRLNCADMLPIREEANEWEVKDSSDEK